MVQLVLSVSLNSTISLLVKENIQRFLGKLVFTSTSTRQKETSFFFSLTSKTSAKERGFLKV